MKPKQLLEYFWSFYKWQILAAFVVAALGISLLWTALSKKECALSVMLIDCHTDAGQEQMEQDLLLALTLDAKQYQVQVQNNLMFANTDSGSYAMTSLSRFLADVGSETLDVCAMTEQDYYKYEASGTFMNLRECFSEEELAALAPYTITAEDGRIFGLWANQLPGMQQYGCYESGQRGAVGIVYNTRHLETAKRYLWYLAGFAESNDIF